MLKLAHRQAIKTFRFANKQDEILDLGILLRILTLEVLLLTVGILLLIYTIDSSIDFTFK